MKVKVKICGLTRAEDVFFLGGLEIDFAGFVFVPGSPRALDPGPAASLTVLLPQRIKRVGVFADEEPGRIREAIAGCRLDILQFHGEESPDYCGQFGLPYFKAFRMREDFDFSRLDSFRPRAFLLDAFSPGERGGTGRTFNWELALRARGESRRIILAGGLSPENVAGALSLVQPWGVDVSSGVESAPGIKDRTKIEAFLRAVKNLNNDETRMPKARL